MKAAIEKSEQPSFSESVWPEITAGLWSTWTYAWMDPLLKKGHKQPLEEEDIWKADNSLLTEVTTPPLEDAWKTQQESAKKPSLLKALWGLVFKEVFFRKN